MRESLEGRTVTFNLIRGTIWEVRAINSLQKNNSWVQHRQRNVIAVVCTVTGQPDGYFLVQVILDIIIIKPNEAISDNDVELGLIQKIQATLEG